MGLNDFIYNGRVATFDKVNVKQTLNVGNQTIYSNQGNSYFVDSGSGSSSNTGKSWAQALATIDQAINKCTANQGDRIIVAEGHSESYTTTGAKATFDVAGIEVICLGQGSDRSTFSFGHTGATWTISAANVVIRNALFVTAVDSVVTFGTISGADCALIGCESRDVTDKEVVTDFTVTGDRFVALNHFKNGYVSGNANDCVFSLNGVDNALIQNCIFMTKVLTAVVEFVTAACSNVVVKNCEFYVSGTTDFSKTVVDTITGSTWEVNSGFDLGAGSKFSGGSGAALAGDDVSAVSTAVAAVQTDLGNPSARTNLQTIELLAGAGGIASFPAAAAPANDVSLAEVIRDIWDSLRNGTGGSEPATNLSIVDEIRKNALSYNNAKYISVTADLTSATWNTVATHELFTVTGLVRMRVIAEVVTTGDDTSGNTSNIQLGVEDSTNDWIAATEVDDLTAGEIWADATPTETNGNYSSLVFDKVVNSKDVGYEITGEAATDGNIVFHCWYEALNSTGAVVAGDGSAMV